MIRCHGNPLRSTAAENLLVVRKDENILLIDACPIMSSIGHVPILHWVPESFSQMTCISCHLDKQL